MKNTILHLKLLTDSHIGYGDQYLKESEHVMIPKISTD